MKFGEYLKSNAYVLVIAAFLALMVAIIVRAIGGGESLALFAALLALGSFTVALMIDYARRSRFYSELAALAEGLDNPRLAISMIERPAYPEGRIVCEAVERISKSANDDVAQYRQRAEDYREYVETWVHEAKSPLSAAHLMLENIAEEKPAAWEERCEALCEELDRVEGYIEQALFYARSEAVERDYLIRSCSLRDLCASAVKANARALIGAHVAVRLDGLGDLAVFADEKWMLFILGQLIQNSVKYARESGAELAFDARRVGEGSADEHIELAVRDNGCGVVEADLPRVFDKGFTGENGRTGKRSTGIGLYLVKRLCDKMALRVGAQSRPGEGFAVTICFPANRMHMLEDM